MPWVRDENKKRVSLHWSHTEGFRLLGGGCSVSVLHIGDSMCVITDYNCMMNLLMSYITSSIQLAQIYNQQ